MAGRERTRFGLRATGRFFNGAPTSASIEKIILNNAELRTFYSKANLRSAHRKKGVIFMGYLVSARQGDNFMPIKMGLCEIQRITVRFRTEKEGG